jgi:hypothetical protein
VVPLCVAIVCSTSTGYSDVLSELSCRMAVMRCVLGCVEEARNLHKMPSVARLTAAVVPLLG